MKKINLFHFITDSSNHPYLYSLTDYADKSLFNISVGSLHPEGDLHKFYKQKDIQTLSLDTTKRKNFVGAILKLSRWLKSEKIDIIQTHLFDASLVGLTAAKLAGTPLKILTGHHSHEMQFYKKKLSFYGDCLSSRFLADYIIAPSEQMKEIFVKDEGVSPEKIAVVHHGFDFENWKISDDGRQSIRKEFDLSGKIVFGAVGKIFWIKNYPMLLEVFKPIAEKNSNAVLMIVGSGDQNDLRRLASELKIENQIIFTGWRSDIANIFSAIDVFVHPSVAESFGLVVVEAMAMEKPVICTDVGIAREIIEDGKNGFVVPTGDAEKFTEAMEKIIALRENWNEIGKINCELAKKLTAEKMVAGYEACYIKWLKALGKLKPDFNIQITTTS